MPNPSKHTAPQVLIVGAGPTGLTLANALTRYGIDFMIVDRKKGPTNDSKGLALSIASQYAFDLLEMSDRMQQGNKVHRLAIFWQGKRLTAVDFRRLDFPIRHLITGRQAVTEQQLILALRSQEHEILWDTEVLDIEEREEGVHAHWRLPDGTEQTAMFDYVVGCDGKSSLVRQVMKADFSGHDYPMYFVLGDFELDWDGRENQVYYYVFEEDFFLLVPIGDGCWRVVVKCDGTPPANSEPISQELITGLVTRLLGRNIFSQDALWISQTPFYSRICDHLRKGRLFVAGDAAHLVSPLGGTGMNAGIQDALNLAWKLAWRIQGLAPDALLDSYERERLHAIKETVLTTDRSTLLISRIEIDNALVAPFLPHKANRDYLRKHFPLLYSGLMLNYPADVLLGGSRALKAGSICNWASTLIAELRAGKCPFSAHQGLVAADMSLTEVDEDNCPVGLTELYDLSVRHAAFFKVVLIASEERCEELRRHFPTLAIVRREALTNLDIAPGEVAFIRPDGILGHIDTLARIEDFIKLITASLG